MKFAIITKPRVFMDWNNEGSIDLDVSPANEISIKAVTEHSSGVLSFGVEDAIRFADGCKSLAEKKTRSTIMVTGDGGCFIQAQRNTDGDPYREGVRITIGVEDQWNDQIMIDLESYHALLFASALQEKASAVVAPEQPEQPELDLHDKAKCWDWFMAQHWNLDAVEAWGSLDFEFGTELETYILKQAR